MEQLLEDYQRRLKTITEKIDSKAYGMSEETFTRLTTKQSCYRTFITELERAILANSKAEV